MKRTFTLPLIGLLGIFISFLLLGCASKHIRTEASETRSEDDKTADLSKGKNAKANSPKKISLLGSIRSKMIQIIRVRTIHSSRSLVTLHKFGPICVYNENI